MEENEIRSPIERKLHSFFKAYIYIFEKSLCNAVFFFVTPMYYLCLVTLVRQTLVKAYRPGKLALLIHALLSVFGFINIAGNMFMSLNTRIRMKKALPIPHSGANYCRRCKMYSPAKSWHCRVCNICIANRDHHCTLFARCIALNNLRYYILYLVYITFGMSFYNYHWYHYLSARYGKNLQLLDILNPVVKMFVSDFFNTVTKLDLQVMLLYVNTAIIIWSSSLLVFHGSNLLRGMTTHEALRDSGNCITMALKAWRLWKKNIIRVFGTRWYLTFFWPFVHSPLPDYD